MASALACLPAIGPVAPAQAAPDRLRTAQWNLDVIRADAAHRVSTGAGALVAVVDTGVQGTHPDLSGSVVNGPDLVDGDQSPDDNHGHGTHVAGIIVAHKNNGLGIAGAAPDAKVLAIRVLDEARDGDTDREAAGIDAAVAAGAQVINLSLSLQPSVVAQFLPGSALVLALERAARAGVVVVAAAGNDGAPLCAQPLLTARILCVGAVDRARSRATYSNYGQRVDLVAPGGDAQSAIRSTAPGGGYGTRVGTSQAAAHVASAAALLVALGLRGDEVIDRLKRTAVGLGDPATGSGLLDAAAAVAGLRGPGEAPLAAPELSAYVPPRVQRETVDRRGLLIRCRSSKAATCTARVVRRGRLLARGEAGVAAGAATAVHAWLTPTGRRVLERARRPLVLVRVTVPGAQAVNRLTMLVP